MKKIRLAIDLCFENDQIRAELLKTELINDDASNGLKEFRDLCLIFRSEYLKTILKIFSEDLRNGKIRHFGNKKESLPFQAVGLN